MKKQRKHYTPDEKVAILRRHLLEQVPISEVCDKHGLQPRLEAPAKTASDSSPVGRLKGQTTFSGRFRAMDDVDHFRMRTIDSQPLKSRS